MEIKNKEIAGFVRYVLEEFPEYGQVSSSRSGHYHPQDEYRPGGNRVHVARVVRVLEHLIRDDEGKAKFRTYKPLTQEEKDVLIAAAILHDINKVTPNGGATCGPNLISRELSRYFGRGWNRSQPWGLLLVELIAVHGGPFYKEVKVNKKRFTYDPENRLHRLLHLADFIASRNDISVNINKTTDQKNKVPFWKQRFMKWYLGRLYDDSQGK